MVYLRPFTDISEDSGDCSMTEKQLTDLYCNFQYQEVTVGLSHFISFFLLKYKNKKKVVLNYLWLHFSASNQTHG